MGRYEAFDASSCLYGMKKLGNSYRSMDTITYFVVVKNLTNKEFRTRVWAGITALGTLGFKFLLSQSRLRVSALLELFFHLGRGSSIVEELGLRREEIIAGIAQAVR